MLTPSLITCHNRAILTVLQRHYTTTSQLPNICKFRIIEFFYPFVYLDVTSFSYTLNTLSELD